MSNCIRDAVTRSLIVGAASARAGAEEAAAGALVAARTAMDRVAVAAAAPGAIRDGREGEVDRGRGCASGQGQPWLQRWRQLGEGPSLIPCRRK